MKKLLLLFLLLTALQVHANENNNDVLSRPNLKILILGNTYMFDGLFYLKDITENSGSDISDMCLYSVLRSDATFKDWVNVYNDVDVYTYAFAKQLGGISSKVAQGGGAAGDGSLLRNILKNDVWDLILIQPNSTQAPYYENWVEDFNKLRTILNNDQPNAKIGLILVHSYWDSYVHNTEKDSYARWQLIAESAKKLKENNDIDFILPYGTAVENLRKSSLNNDYDLTRDGTHLAYGLGRYVAGCCYYETLIAPRSGKSVLGDSKRTQIDTNSVTSSYPIIDVTDDNAPLAQIAAIQALRSPYTCENPEYADEYSAEETLTVTNTEGNGYGYCTFSSVYDLDFSEVDDIKVYIASGYNSLNEEITGLRVKEAPAFTGLLVYGKAGTYTIPCKKSYSYYVNMFVGVPVKKWVATTDGIYTNFILGRRDGTTNFYRLSEDGYIEAKHAYLQIPTAMLNTAKANHVGIIFEEEEDTNGISEAVADTDDDSYYTLTGIRVSHPRSGLYLHKGKKVLVK